MPKGVTMMNDAMTFATFACCFAPVERDEWNAIRADASWSDFLSGARSLLQDERPLGATLPPIGRARRGEPLSDFLAETEVRALFTPPTHDEKTSFSARHFTGGLPQSTVPVESLYTAWSKPGDGPFAGRTGLYLGDSALYMRDLMRSMGIAIPDEFASTPDHLAIELDLIATMLEAGMAAEAQTFCIERLAWLGSYRTKLMALGDEGLFYLALVDALIGIRARQEALASASAASA
ncbi:molecular chaperone TorD family protein [Slackia equolifaciens]|nr:molecular chaperone TorD family protein [Slackia equolifaciens]